MRCNCRTKGIQYSSLPGVNEVWPGAGAGRDGRSGG